MFLKNEKYLLFILVKLVSIVSNLLFTLIKLVSIVSNLLFTLVKLESIVLNVLLISLLFNNKFPDIFIFIAFRFPILALLISKFSKVKLLFMIFVKFVILIKPPI